MIASFTFLGCKVHEGAENQEVFLECASREIAIAQKSSSRKVCALFLNNYKYFSELVSNSLVAGTLLQPSAIPNRFSEFAFFMTIRVIASFTFLDVRYMKGRESGGFSRKRQSRHRGCTKIELQESMCVGSE